MRHTPSPRAARGEPFCPGAGSANFHAAVDTGCRHRPGTGLSPHDKPAEARAVIRIGIGIVIVIVIGGADGDFDQNEQAVVREACFAPGLPPHGFGL
ncbi:hypothetical protein GCM10027162_22100 [Streptomyces incanus]